MRVNTSRYEFNMCEKPQGFGDWIFRIGCETFWFENMEYKEARRKAVRKAKQLDIDGIYLEP